jgi:hypothetical protein
MDKLTPADLHMPGKFKDWRPGQWSIIVERVVEDGKVLTADAAYVLPEQRLALPVYYKLR